MKQRIAEITDSLKGEIFHWLKDLYDNPELSGEEFESSKKFAGVLKSHSFAVEQPYAGMETAFKAVKPGKAEHPRIAYLAEYDALPDIGHGCGHNWIGTCSTFAGIVLSKLVDEKKLNGSVAVFGTPMEETIGGKILMQKQGAFKDVDAAMMVHPSTESHGGYQSLACLVIEINFKGKPAHAAASPWKGINALDALIQTFIAIDQLKKQLRPTVKIPGVITHGGTRPNVVPERATGVFSVRGETIHEMREVLKKVINCAEAAALATGATLEWHPTEEEFFDFRVNPTLYGMFEKNFQEFGGQLVRNPNKGQGSLDMGNLSHDFPCLHGYVQICGFDIGGHTTEFRDATLTDFGKEQLLRAINTLALTGAQMIENPELLAKSRNDLELKSA